MQDKKTHILIFIDWYLPGYKAGGPIRSVANLVEAFHDQYDFSIVTSDRDLGDDGAYSGVETDEWVEVEHCKVWYASPERNSYRHLRNLIFGMSYDVLYVQSMFSLKYSLFPIWSSRAMTEEAKIVLAPRGMLHQGAIGLKRRKKRLFLRFFRFFGMHKSLTFQATDAQEQADIRQHFGDVKVVQAPNLPRMSLPEAQNIDKLVGQLKLVFFSRLTIKKGLHLVLEALQNQQAQISLDLYGVQDEPEYWARCAALIEDLPSNITVKYQGTVPPSASTQALQKAHTFIMPTLGENFGHAIFESLAAGRPVIISDQTPWQELEARQAGYVISLDEALALEDAIRGMAAMDQQTWNVWARGARDHATDYLQNLKFKSAYNSIFSPPENV